MSSTAIQPINETNDELTDDATFLSLDLNDLTNPHQMSTYFASLYRYRHCFGDKSDDNNSVDKQLCNSIARFVYSNQIDGQFFLDQSNPFTESDLEDMLSSISSHLDPAPWIWNMLSWTINESLRKTKTKPKQQKNMKWITSSWTKHQIIAAKKNECQPQSDNPLNPPNELNKIKMEQEFDEIVTQVGKEIDHDYHNTPEVHSGGLLILKQPSKEMDEMIDQVAEEIDHDYNSTQDIS